MGYPARDLVYIWEPDHLHVDRTPHVVRLLPQGEWTLCERKLLATDLVNTQTSMWIERRRDVFCKECLARYVADRLSDDRC